MTRKGPRRAPHAVFAALLVLALAACDGADGTAAPTSTPSASPSPTADPRHFPTERFAALSERPLPAATAAELQTALLEAAGGRGVTATVMTAAGTWTGAVGRAEGKARMSPAAQMAIGSVTKTIVAAQVMRLAEAGRLSLADPVVNHLPAWARRNTNRATIRDLLGMRSGLAEYVGEELNHPADRRKGETWRQALARVGRPTAPPGGEVEYINTNFLLLGLVVETVEGRSLAKSLRSGVLAGPGLARLVLQPEERPSRPMAMPFAEVGAFEKGGGFLPDYSAISGAGGAGAMASDALTLARWWARFCAGKVVSQASLDEMTAFRLDYEDYGLGLVPSGGSHAAIGHEGLQVGFSSSASCLYDDGIVMTVLANEQEFDAGDVVQVLADVITP